MRERIISILKSKVYIGEERLIYFISDIEKIYDEFEKNILCSTYKKNAFISPELIGIDVCILIILGISVLLEDLADSKNNILSELDEGQIILYKGKKYKYIKCESIENDYLGKQKMLILKAKDGILKIMEDKAYNITRYFGNSNRIDRMERQNVRENGKYLITRLLDLDINDLNGSLKQEILVVFHSKKYMEELIEKINIEIDGELYNFGSVFPTKYYSSIENNNYIKGNINHLKPIFLFTSKFDIADQLLDRNKENTTLLFLREASYIKQFSILEYILEDNLKNIIFYNTFSQTDAVERLVQNDVKINAITYINNLIIQSPSNIIVENEPIDNLLLDIKKRLIKLLKNTNYSFCDKEIFMKNTFKLLKMFQILFIPICETEEKDVFDQSMDNVKNILEENKEYYSIYKELECIYSNFKQLYELLYDNNPKFDILEKYSNRHSVIIVNNKSEEDFIKSYQNIRFKSIKRIKDLKELNFEEVIFMGLYNKKSIEQFGLYVNNDIINILYCIEVKKYNYLVNIINNNLKIIYENNRICEKNSKKYISYIKNINFEKKQVTPFLKEEESIIEVNVTEKINNNIDEYENIEDLYYYDFEDDIKSILNIVFENEVPKYNVENYQMKAYKKITFKNNSFAYLSKNYKAFCINSSKDSIIRVVDDLKIKDKIIFINDKIDQDIDDLMGTIINSDIFQEKYTKDFNNVNYFKDIIKEYCERYEDGYKILSNELNFHHINKGVPAIKQWCSSRITGPREKEVYEVISKIIRTDKLLNGWEEIYNSSEVIRKFKTRLKDICKNMLRCNIDNDLDNELVNLIIDIFQTRNNYIDIVEISKIENINTCDPQLQLNCLLK